MIYFLIQLGIIILFSLILSFQDIKSGSVSRWIVLIACICELIFQFYKCIYVNFNGDKLFLQLLSAVILMALYYVIFFILKGKLGFGDILFGTFSGLCLNLKALWIFLVLQVAFGFTYLIIRKLTDKKTDLKTLRIPFIPFMSSSLLITYLLQFFVFKF